MPLESDTGHWPCSATMKNKRFISVVFKRKLLVVKKTFILSNCENKQCLLPFVNMNYSNSND